MRSRHQRVARDYDTFLIRPSPARRSPLKSSGFCHCHRFCNCTYSFHLRAFERALSLGKLGNQEKGSIKVKWGLEVSWRCERWMGVGEGSDELEGKEFILVQKSELGKVRRDGPASRLGQRSGGKREGWRL